MTDRDVEAIHRRLEAIAQDVALLRSDVRVVRGKAEELERHAAAAKATAEGYLRKARLALVVLKRLV